MLIFWAFFALMTFAVKSASSVKKWTYFKAEYASKGAEGRSSRGTSSELGPHAYRGTRFEGPAWSVDFFLDDPQLFIESPWYNRIQRDTTPLTQDEDTTLAEVIHKYTRDPRSFQSSSYCKWDDRDITTEPTSDDDYETQMYEGDDDYRVFPSDEDDDISLPTRTKASDNRFIGNG